MKAQVRVHFIDVPHVVKTYIVQSLVRPARAEHLVS